MEVLNVSVFDDCLQSLSSLPIRCWGTCQKEHGKNVYIFNMLTLAFLKLILI